MRNVVKVGEGQGCIEYSQKKGLHSTYTEVTATRGVSIKEQQWDQYVDVMG